MIGKRVQVNENGMLLLKPGEYGKQGSAWMCRPPRADVHMGNLTAHTVVEHEDGTITVSPSILITQEYGDNREKITWHGYLTNGVWKEC